MGRLKRRPSHNSPKCPKFRGSVSELGQQQVAQKEKTASRRSLRNPVRYLSLLKTPKAKEILEFLRHSEF